MMTPGVRRFALTSHVISSVGWLGAVAAFLVLSIAGQASDSAEIVRSSYIAMNLIGRYIIVPMSLAAVASGLVQALGTEWGLFRHLWVLAKFVLTILATIALLLHQFTAVEAAAKLVSGAADATLPSSQLGEIGKQLIGDASLAIVVLLAVTTLSIYKPWGLTAHGKRKQQERRLQSATASVPMTALSEDQITERNDGTSRSLRITLALIGIALLLFIIKHLVGGGMGRHG